MNGMIFDLRYRRLYSTLKESQFCANNIALQISDSVRDVSHRFSWFYDVPLLIQPMPLILSNSTQHKELSQLPYCIRCANNQQYSAQTQVPRDQQGLCHHFICPDSTNKSNIV
jgi:hypothetical protein